MIDYKNLHKSDPKKLYLPIQMPMFAGSPGYLNNTPKMKLTYMFAWFIIGICGALINSSTVVYINEIKAHYFLNQFEASFLTCVYFMFSSWASLFLFKLRQHFGVHFFLKSLTLGLIIALFIRLVFASFFAEIISRAFDGLICTGLSVASIFYAGSFLPAPKRILMLVLGLGITQLGMPIARVFSIFIDDGHILFIFENILYFLAILTLRFVPLPPSFKTPAFDSLNLASISLFALSAMVLCFAFSFMPYLWWDGVFIPVMVSVGFMLLIALIIIEYNRTHPLLSIKFLSKKDLIKIILIASCIRMFLAEQNMSTSGFFINSLGFNNESLFGLYVVIFLGAVFGFIICLVLMNKTNRFNLINHTVLIAFSTLCLGSFLNTSLSPVSVPKDVYLGQFFLAFSGVLFLAPIMLDGMLKSFVRGSLYLVSFAAVFSFCQNVFGLLGSGVINLYLQLRTKEYLAAFYEKSTGNFAYLKTLASANAYNDLFYIVSFLSLIVCIYLALELIYIKIKNITIHSRELQILQTKMKKRAEETQEILSKLNKN